MPQTFDKEGVLEQLTNQQADIATRAVPDSERSTKKSLTMAWWGVCSALFYIFLAAALAVAYGTMNTIIGMVLSVIVYGLINSLLTRYAIRTGFSVSLFSETLFGRIGSLLATLIFCLTAIYYAVFEGSVIAVTIAKVAPDISYGVACIIVVAYSVPLVFGSVQKWLDKLNGFLLPFYLIGLVVAVSMAIYAHGYNNDWLTYVPESGVSDYAWMNVFVAYMGVWVLMMFTFDFARFGKKEDEEYHAKFNFGIPFYVVTFLINGLVGIFLVLSGKLSTISETVVVEQLILVMGGVLAVIFVWVTQTRINSANFFLATVNMQAFFKVAINLDLKKWMWAVIVGIVVLVMMRATDVFSYILLALTYQGIFVTSWVGVAVAHILFCQTDNTHKIDELHWPGLVAWFVGTTSGFVMSLTQMTGHEWAPLITVSLAFVLYPLLKRIENPATVQLKEQK